MDEEISCKIEIPEYEAAIDENTEEEKANKNEEEEIVKIKQELDKTELVEIKQESDKTEFVEIKQEQKFSDKEDCQTNIESLPDPLSIRGLNTTTEIDEKQTIEDIEPNSHVHDKKENKFQC